LKLSRREKRDEKKGIGKNSINRKEIDSQGSRVGRRGAFDWIIIVIITN